MGGRPSQSWGRIALTLADLDIAKVLVGGQSFRWQKNCDDEWVGVFGSRLWALKQTTTQLQYKLIAGGGGGLTEGGEASNNHTVDTYDALSKEEELIRNYFQLDISLPNLYNEWALKDAKFGALGPQWGGIRILAQDPLETIFAFICSSNNHIGRISGMVNKLCTLYGTHIGDYNEQRYHNFPPLEALLGSGVEATLRSEAFGYRAGYITKSAQIILNNGGIEGWVEKLKGSTYQEARTQLQTLSGVGRKVADCICLMSLGFSEAIPVDTHIHQIAKGYLPHLSKVKTLTDKVYTEITNHFQSLYGQYAGWAHAVLFMSSLKHLQQQPKPATTHHPEEQDLTTPKKNTIVRNKRRKASEGQDSTKAKRKPKCNK